MARPRGHGPGYQAKHRDIIDLAARLFASRGYAATSMAELGSAAGLGKGALYYYIGSKENLLVEIQSRVLTPLLETAARISNFDEPPALRLRFLSEILIQTILDKLDHVWVYEHDYRHLTGSNLTRLLEQRRSFERVIQELLTEAMDTGEFRKMSSRLAMLQFLNLHNHTYQWARPTGQWNAQYLSREFCKTLFVGFGYTSDGIAALERRISQLRIDNQ